MSADAEKAFEAYVLEADPCKEMNAGRLVLMRDAFLAGWSARVPEGHVVVPVDNLVGVMERANHGIPHYAYGDNEAACLMASALAYVVAAMDAMIAAKEGE